MRPNEREGPLADQPPHADDVGAARREEAPYGTNPGLLFHLLVKGDVAADGLNNNGLLCWSCMFRVGDASHVIAGATVQKRACGATLLLLPLFLAHSSKASATVSGASVLTAERRLEGPLKATLVPLRLTAG